MPVKFDPSREYSDEEAEAAALKEYDRRFMEAFHSPDSPVGENLRAFRLREGLKKKEVSELMGVTPRTYYAYELGTRAIPSDALIKLATMTCVDLNEILMGRSSETDQKVVQSAIEDVMKIMKFLGENYPSMNMKTQLSVATHAVTTDTGDWPRLHPEMIESSVKMVTGYKYHSADVPSPPDPDGFGDNIEAYEKADARWWKELNGEMSE